MKSRITLTIDENILQKIDETIDGSIIKNRSHAFELMVRNKLQKNVPSKAILLAGGPGRFVKVNGKKTIQHLLRINNKTIIEQNLLLLKKYGIKEIIISLGEDQQEIEKELGSGSKLGLNIQYYKEKENLGTSGVIRELRNNFKTSFIVCNGDELKEINLKKLYTFHKNNKGMATISLTTTNNPSNYGVALLNGNNIIAFIEKPVKGSEPSKLINAGLYILDPSVIDLIPEGFSRFEYDVFPKLASQEKLNGFVFSGQWFDVDGIKQYEFAKKEWKDKLLK